MNFFIGIFCCSKPVGRNTGVISPSSRVGCEDLLTLGSKFHSAGDLFVIRIISTCSSGSLIVTLFHPFYIKVKRFPLSKNFPLKGSLFKYLTEVVVNLSVHICPLI